MTASKRLAHIKHILIDGKQQLSRLVTVTYEMPTKNDQLTLTNECLKDQ